MFFIRFSRILPLYEFFYVAKSFQLLQNQYKFSIILFRIMKNWRFDMILLCLKWFCYIEKLIEWQNSRKAYEKQTLVGQVIFISKLNLLTQPINLMFIQLVVLALWNVSKWLGRPEIKEANNLPERLLAKSGNYCYGLLIWQEILISWLRI